MSKESVFFHNQKVIQDFVIHSFDGDHQCRVITDKSRDICVKSLYKRFEDLQSVFTRNFNQSNYSYCDYLVPVVVQVVQAIEEITGDSPLFLSDELHRRVNGHSSLELEHG